MAGNAGNLSELSTSVPNIATEPKSVLDDYQRELRRAAKRSIGKEHDLVTGAHKFPTGPDADRPLNPTDGQVYFNTERGAIEQYDSTTDPDNPAWVRRFFQQDHAVHLCSMVPGQRNGIGYWTYNLVTVGGLTAAAAPGCILACPGAFAGKATASSLLAASDVYLYKGTYTVRATAYLARIVDGVSPALAIDDTVKSNAGTTLTQQIGTAGSLGSVTIVSGSSNADQWVDNSAEIVVTTAGWYPLELYGSNASNGFLVQSNSVFFERTG